MKKSVSKVGRDRVFFPFTSPASGASRELKRIMNGFMT